MLGLGNPILDEIDQKHAELSPSAQQAIALSGAPANARALMSGDMPGASPSPAPLVSTPAGAPAAPAESAPAPIAAPTRVQGLGPAAPSPADAHKAELNRLVGSPSGIGQIHNPWARHGLQVLDALGGAFFPGFEQRLPGTQGHHDVLVRQAQGNVNEDEKLAGDEAAREHTAAETGELGARAAHEKAEAVAAGAKPTNEWAELKDLVTDPEHPELGPQAAFFNKNNPKQGLVYGHAPAAATPKDETPSIHVLPDGRVVSVHRDPKTGKSMAEVVYEGDPKVETDLADLEVNGKPHKVIVNKKTGETIKDLGPSGIKPPVVSVNAGNAALDHEIGQYGKPWQTMSTGVSSQLDKILDAEKMVAGGAVDQALGIPKVLTALVSGQGSGVRITQAELNSIAHARGIEGDIQGFIQKASGKGQLTAQQQQELSGLLHDVRQRILQKKAIADSAIDEMQAGQSRSDILAADKKARGALDALERGAGSAPKTGDVVDGFRFKGGDPSKQTSWEKVNGQ